jgi:hypothetical protein
MTWLYRLPVLYFLRFGRDFVGSVRTETTNKSDARAAIKRKLGIDRLPPGSDVRPA